MESKDQLFVFSFLFICFHFFLKYICIFFLFRDINGDGIPDIPLRYEFADSKSVVQFPLGFCPNTTLAPGFVQNKSVATTSSCIGQWGIVVKEWETMTATYPKTGKYSVFFLKKKTTISVSGACDYEL